MTAFPAFVRAGFLRLLAYRLRYYTGILTYTIHVSVYYFIWRAVFTHAADGESLVGFRLAEITTYVALGWIVRSFHFNNIDREIAALVAEGHITSYLARPVDLLSAMTGLAAGESLFRIAAFTGPVTIVIFLLFPVLGPAGFLAATLFVVSAVLSFLVLTYLNFLIGLIAFQTRSINGIISAKTYALQLLSGLLMPLAFFPDWLRDASWYLPFRHISHTPVALYLGRFADAAAWENLAWQVGWVVVLFACARLAWHRMARRLVIQGG